MKIRVSTRIDRGVASALVASMLAASTPAMAASQGSLGTTSTGSVSINASVPSRVRISGLTDVNLLNLDPGADALNAQNVCVWSNTATAGYSITASGSGTGSAFTLAAGADAVPYSVEWSGSTGQTTGTALNPLVPSTGFTSAATHQLCSSGPASSASLVVKLSAADLALMQAGQSYNGTLTLLVQPE